MTEQLYQIVFSGQLVDGVDPAQAKANLSKLYKTDVSKVEKLFKGKPVVLKKNLGEDAALRYMTALKNAGVICKLEDMPIAAGAAESGKPGPATTALPPKIDAGAFADVTVAPAGEVIMTHPKIAPPAIDTSQLNMAPVGEDLIERTTVKAPDIDTSSLSMGTVGETLADKVEVEPFTPDLSDIDLAPVGSTIGPNKKEPPPPPPDTSHISLKEEK